MYIESAYAFQSSVVCMWALHWDDCLHTGSYTGTIQHCGSAGKHETSSMEDFSWGVANRGVSIRVGRNVPVDKCGYYEDRRPASNLDPYVVIKLLVESALL